MLVVVLFAEVDRSRAAGGDDVAGPLCLEQRDDGGAGGADARNDNPDLGEFFVHDAQGVGQGCQRDDCGSVLVVVEDRDVELLAEPGFDLEAARSGDVLKVDPAVDRGERLDDPDDFLRVLGVQADRPGVDVGELLEERGLAFHDRQCGGRADVAEAQDGGAVGDDGDGVAFDGQVPGGLRVFRDRQADAGDAGGVGAGEVVPVAQGDLRHNLQLAAEVHQEGSVRDVPDRDAVERVERVLDACGVVVVRGVAGDVDYQGLVVGLGDVQGRDRGAGRTDGGGQFAGGTEAGRRLHTQGDRISGARIRH
ncbi:hypothetical protein SRABI128_06262 [Microbacterium sp. Bi128]|nr:hypothetical protein SRABI128_06262 [Microbacterium sp. Bi128]